MANDSDGAQIRLSHALQFGSKSKRIGNTRRSVQLPLPQPRQSFVNAKPPIAQSGSLTDAVSKHQLGETH